ncbi:MAG TPA: YdcF family protein [Candidatus Limnocylindria bacterium]|nr:YdcF family protein [Candidatus Limnocylindria bacterium]
MTHAQSKTRNDRRRIVLLLLLALLAGGIIALRGAGRWLVREDPLSRADAILVLSGGLPYRAEAAATIFRGGYAPEVWVTRPESPAPDLLARGIHYVGEEEYDRDILIAEGVSESAVRILPGTIVDTEQEVEATAREMRSTGKTSVIIVTSPQHTRRVRALWKHVVGNSLKIMVRAAPEDPFDADHWWRNTRDALSVVREYLGLANVWAGLPVRPHSP